MKKLLEDALKIRRLQQSLQHVECVHTFRKISEEIDDIEKRIKEAILKFSKRGKALYNKSDSTFSKQGKHE